MTKPELEHIGRQLTAEDLADLLSAFFHARNRVGNISITVTARREDTYSPVERLDFEESKAFNLSV